VSELLTPVDGSEPVEPDPLTRRERQIAELVAEGGANREIARALHISQRTVEADIEHAFSKLGFNNRAQLAAWVGSRR
jgi:non-specific serine/threonine protein kinase